MGTSTLNQSTSGSTLARYWKKILDKGVVIAGDISIALADVELLTIKIRLVVASIDKAKEMASTGGKRIRTFPARQKGNRRKRKRKKAEEPISGCWKNRTGCLWSG
jgi:hypothetical protein